MKFLFWFVMVFGRRVQFTTLKKLHRMVWDLGHEKLTTVAWPSRDSSMFHMAGDHRILHASVGGLRRTPSIRSSGF